MQNMPEFTEMMRFLKTPEGQQLLSLLQGADPTALSSAVKSARNGDMESAKNALSSLLSSQDLQNLIAQFGGSYGGNG